MPHPSPYTGRLHLQSDRSGYILYGFHRQRRYNFLHSPHSRSEASPQSPDLRPRRPATPHLHTVHPRSHGSPRPLRGPGRLLPLHPRTVPLFHPDPAVHLLFLRPASLHPVQYRPPGRLHDPDLPSYLLLRVLLSYLYRHHPVLPSRLCPYHQNLPSRLPFRNPLLLDLRPGLLRLPCSSTRYPRLLPRHSMHPHGHVPPDRRPAHWYSIHRNAYVLRFLPGRRHTRPASHSTRPSVYALRLPPPRRPVPPDRGSLLYAYVLPFPPDRRTGQRRNSFLHAHAPPDRRQAPPSWQPRTESEYSGHFRPPLRPEALPRLQPFGFFSAFY